MKLNHFKLFSYFILAVVLTLGLSISLQSLLAAWTAPLASPPICTAGNPGCDAPLNIGALMQVKSGALWLNTNGVSPYGLIIEKGNVGIGTTNPVAPLTIQGGATTKGTIQINNDVTTGIPNAVKFLQTDNTSRSDLKKGCVSMGIATGGSAYGGNFYVATQGVNQGSTGTPSCDVSQDGVVGNVAMAINPSNGNVGIGTANPTTAKLVVNGTISASIPVNDSDVTTKAWVLANAGGGGGITGGCWSQTLSQGGNWSGMVIPWGKGCNYYYGSGFVRCDLYTATGYACGLVSEVFYPSTSVTLDFCLCVKQ